MSAPHSRVLNASEDMTLEVPVCASHRRVLNAPEDMTLEVWIPSANRVGELQLRSAKVCTRMSSGGVLDELPTFYRQSQGLFMCGRSRSVPGVSG